MMPDSEPTIPESFHHQFEFERFLAEMWGRIDSREKEAARRRRRYFAGTAICWLAVILVLSISTHQGSRVANKPSQPSIPAPREVPALVMVVNLQGENLMSPLQSESDELKRVIDQLGRIEVQGSLYTHTGESYRGPLWVRSIKSGDRLYLEGAVPFEIDGPFRLALPSNSTVHIYAPAVGLDWNGGWGVPIKTPPDLQCSQAGTCACRLEDLMIASMGK